MSWLKYVVLPVLPFHTNLQTRTHTQSLEVDKDSDQRYDFKTYWIVEQYHMSSDKSKTDSVAVDHKDSQSGWPIT